MNHSARPVAPILVYQEPDDATLEARRPNVLWWFLSFGWVLLWAVLGWERLDSQGSDGGFILFAIIVFLVLVAAAAGGSTDHQTPLLRIEKLGPKEFRFLFREKGVLTELLARQPECRLKTRHTYKGRTYAIRLLLPDGQRLDFYLTERLTPADVNRIFYFWEGGTDPNYQPSGWDFQWELDFDVKGLFNKEKDSKR